MPNIFSSGRSAASGRAGGNIFNTRRPSGRTAEPLTDKEARLTQLHADIGAPAIEQEKPGLFSTLIDVLSRPNFATAGFVEEMLNGKSITSGLARATSEMLSGIGGIQGQKRAFGQVLEEQGVNTVSLADVIPALEGTWVGNFGSRGAAGLALDIITDPLTYVTFGTASFGRHVLREGGEDVVKHLSKRGVDELALIRNAPDIKPRMEAALLKLDDPVKSGKELLELDDEIGRRFTERFSEKANPEMFDPGGAKFFGKMVPGTSGLGRKFGTGVVWVANKTPGGPEALAAASEVSKGFQRGINSLFSPIGEAANLPEPMRLRWQRLKRDFTKSNAVINNRMVAIHKPLERQFRKLEKKTPNLGERLYRVQYDEGLKRSDLTPDELQLLEQYEGLLFNPMRDTALEHGILNKAQIRPRYLPANYENIADLTEYHMNLGGRFSGDVSANFTKEKVFESPFAAARESAKQHARQAAADKSLKKGTVPVYPILRPDFDLPKATNRYIHSYSESIARKAWREQAVHDFGINIVKEDKSLLYDRALDVAADEVDEIETFIIGKGWAKSLDEDTLVPDVKPKTTITEKDTQEVLRVMGRLSKDGQRAFMQQIDRFAKSSDDVSQIYNAVIKSKKLSDDVLPDYRGAVLTGSVEEPFRRFHGAKAATYVTRKGSFYGENGVSVPKAIADEIENVNARILNTKDHVGLQKVIQGYDRVNNLFKLGVYTFWPASATRDLYSNVALSMQDIALGAINPSSHRHTIKIMHAIHGGKSKLKFANDSVTLGGNTYRIGDLAKMAENFGVDVPGRVFVEKTGDAAKRGVVQKRLDKLADFRGLIENEARIQLWVQNINRGLSPRRAADQVAEFLFDYGELSQFEREFMRRAIPFYTFTRKNIELQWKQLRRAPGLSINQVKPFRHREDEGESMVKWEAEALGIRLDRDGKTVHAIQGIDLPLRNLDTLWSGGFGPSARRMAGMLSPVLKVPAEAVTGVSFFTGQRLNRTESATVGRVLDSDLTPQAMKDWFGYKKVVDDAGRPTYSFDAQKVNLVFRSWVVSRALSTSDRQFREYLSDGTPDLWAMSLDLLTGLRRKELNMDEQMQRKMERRVRQLQDAIQRRGHRVKDDPRNVSLR